jgi:CMP-N,N'-diacetyllegionaminic acid synthase
MKRNVVALIPVRSGSKRLKNKNIKILGNKYLFQWSLNIAKKISFFSKIIVSSDSKKILKIIKDKKIEKNLRPKKLSNDNANLVDVSLYIFEFYKKKKFIIDDIVLLQPTSPFRSKKIIIEGLKKYYSCAAKNSVVSISKLNKHPRTALIKKKNIVKPYIKNHALNSQSQDLNEIFAPNGSLYISSVNNLIKNRSFFSKNTYFVDNFFEYEDLDIDNMSNLNLAKLIFSEQKKNIRKWQK